LFREEEGWAEVRSSPEGVRVKEGGEVEDSLRRFIVEDVPADITRHVNSGSRESSAAMEVQEVGVGEEKEERASMMPDFVRA